MMKKLESQDIFSTMVTNSITENYIKLSTEKRTYFFSLNKCDLEEILNEAADLLLTGVLKDVNDYHATIYTIEEGVIIDTNINRELFKTLKRLATERRKLS